MNQKKKSFLDLLVKEVPFEYKLKRYKSAKRNVDIIPYEVDDCHKFRNSVYIQERKNERKREVVEKPKKENKIEPVENIYAIDIIDWEKEIFDQSEEKDLESSNALKSNLQNQLKNETMTVEVKEYVSKLLDSNWEQNICYEPDNSVKPMTLFIDDPNLIFETVDRKQKVKKKPIKNGNLEKPLKNKYNISNDKYYDSEVKSKTSLVSFGVQHSIPALKLNSKFYRINQTKEELRFFHKPIFQMQNKSFPFSNALPTVMDSIIRKPYELTCNDASELVIFEYSEEFPFFIVNPGMVSLLNKYYRKIDQQDDASFKDCIILEPEEEGPFMGYGFVPQGGTMQTIDNNLFVAPVFTHKCSNDFLCINTENKLIFRKINKVCLVGQELPKEEVYAPHSRKLNQFCKDRLKVAAYRIYNKKEDLTMEYLDEVMPYFSEGSKRKWLKEYSDCIKRGKDNVYVPKDNCLMMNEEDLRKLVTPENICQYESMLAGEQRMKDLGYKILEEEEDYEIVPSWILSRNFVSSTNGKGLLELKGPSDPTGIGEGISFGKIKFRKSSESENRRMLSEHQANYKIEISKIWNSQFESLSRKSDPTKTRYNLDIQSLEISAEKHNSILKNKITSPLNEATSEMVDENKCLTIKRTYLENGIEVIKTEKIYDPKVIKAYLLAKKKQKPEEKKSTLTCSNCGQSGHMKTNKNCPKYQGGKKQIEKANKITLNDRMLKIVTQCTTLPNSTAFHRPVSIKKVPTYYTIISNPMDLSQIRNNIRANIYKKYDDFLADLHLIYENCKIFNGPTHSLTDVAREIYEKGTNYKAENFDEIVSLEAKVNSETL